MVWAGNTVENGGVDWQRAWDNTERTDWKTRNEAPEEFNASAFRFSGADHIVVFRNTIDNVNLGFSEAIALVDGTHQLRIVANTLSRVDNIGIDVRGDCKGISHSGAICGNELGTFQCGDTAYGKLRDGMLDPDTTPCPLGRRTGSSVPDARALVGWTKSRASYATEFGRPMLYPNAAGIYVDGGQNVWIEGNRVTGWDYGVQISAEEDVEPPTNVNIQVNALCGNRDAAVHLGHRGKNGGDGPGDCGTVVLKNDVKAPEGGWREAGPRGSCREAYTARIQSAT